MKELVVVVVVYLVEFVSMMEDEEDLQPDSPPGFVEEIDKNELQFIEVQFSCFTLICVVVIATETQFSCFTLICVVVIATETELV